MKPLNTTQVYNIGSTVKFNCSIAPNPLSIDPTVKLRYYWYYSGVIRSYYSISISSINIHQGFTKFNKILCKVRANNIEISHGHYLMEVQGNNFIMTTKIIKSTFMYFLLRSIESCF